MSIATKLAEGQVVKTVNKDGSEISSVDGNILTIQKWGVRKDKDGNEQTLDFSGTTTVLTEEEISAAVALCPTTGTFDTREVCLVLNQVQREDLINSLAAQIRGKAEADPKMKAAKGMAVGIEALGVDEAKMLVRSAKKAGILDQLVEVMGAERVAALS